MKNLLILVTLVLLSACTAAHKGAITPNSGLADFDKYNEAYYLSLEQIKIGDPKEKVIAEYGSKYETKKNDKGREIWVFKSYKATFSRDPIQKLVTVEFINSLVSDVTEKYLRDINTVTTKEPSSEEKLRKLKSLRDDGIITDADFEKKKKEILNEM